MKIDSLQKQFKERLDAMEEKESLGGKIKTIRTAYKLTQKEFAKMIQVTHAHISKIESGKDFPSNSLLTVIISKFNINEKWIDNSLDDLWLFEKSLKGKEVHVDMYMFKDLSYFVSNLKYLQKKLGLSKQEMEDLFRVSSYHLDNIEYLKLNGLRISSLHDISDYFKISPYDIINTQLNAASPENRQNSSHISKEEGIILGIYNACSSQDKKLILEILEKFRC